MDEEDRGAKAAWKLNDGVKRGGRSEGRLKMNLTYLTGSRVTDTNDRANLLRRHGGVLVESEHRVSDGRSRIKAKGTKQRPSRQRPSCLGEGKQKEIKKKEREKKKRENE